MLRVNYKPPKTTLNNVQFLANTILVGDLNAHHLSCFIEKKQQAASRVHYITQEYINKFGDKITVNKIKNFLQKFSVTLFIFDNHERALKFDLYNISMAKSFRTIIIPQFFA